MSFEKDFDGWNEQKKNVHKEEKELFFREGEIRWNFVGVNIGREEDGKGELALRPVLVIKKWNKNIFLDIPLTSKEKIAKHFFMPRLFFLVFTLLLFSSCGTLQDKALPVESFSPSPIAMMALIPSATTSMETPSISLTKEEDIPQKTECEKTFEEKEDGILNTTITPTEKALLKEVFGVDIQNNEIGKNAKGEIICIFAEDKNINKISPQVEELEPLQDLSLDTNNLTTLPFEIGRLKYLHFLSLAHNKFTTLPDGVLELSQLEYLNLNMNKFSTLPSQIQKLTMLKDIYLVSNQMRTLPPEIGNLKNLKNIELIDNQITTLPIGMGELTNLEYLDLISNPISEAEKTRIKALFKEGVVQF